MPHGGALSISTRNLFLEALLEGADPVPPGEFVVLTVADTGVGISEEDVEKIFEPFYTKKNMGRSGTGLGMAVVWGTVKDHGGYIDISSEPGAGTTFTLYFPATRDAVSDDIGSLDLESMRGNGELVMIVDDLKEQRIIGKVLLEKLGYRVCTASSGKLAVEMARSQRPDLLVLDMIMDPGIDGLETFRRIQRIYPEQRAVIASGFSETNRVKQAIQCGVNQYIRKPYTLETLAVAIKAALFDDTARNKQHVPSITENSSPGAA
jgi:CheY-like chemotaxis protein